MIRYLAGRVAEMLVVLLLMSAVVFGLIGLMPGDPVDLMIAGDPNMTSEDAARLRTLASRADVVVQSYRPGSLERRGFGAEDLARLRPGVVVVSVSCYGHVGPWRDRPGWEQLAQSATGLARDQGTPDAPRLIPAAACDYTTGGLAALGALAALWRRGREGRANKRCNVSPAPRGGYRSRPVPGGRRQAFNPGRGGQYPPPRSAFCNSRWKAMTSSSGGW